MKLNSLKLRSDPNSWSAPIRLRCRSAAAYGKRQTSLHFTRIFQSRRGLRPPALGCEERATLGNRANACINPERVMPRYTFRVAYAAPLHSQGSSFLATLGFGTGITLGFPCINECWCRRGVALQDVRAHFRCLSRFRTKQPNTSHEYPI